MSPAALIEYPKKTTPVLYVREKRPIPVYKIPIPLIVLLAGRKLTDQFMTNCIAGDNPDCHASLLLADQKHPLYAQYKKLLDLNDHEKLVNFYNNYNVWGRGDQHPSLRFKWTPPDDEESKKIALNPESDPALLWERSKSPNTFECKCGLRGDVVQFTRMILADQKRNKPCAELNRVCENEAVTYLKKIAQQSHKFKGYRQLYSSEQCVNFSGHHYSAYYHIVLDSGCVPSWEEPECYQFLENEYGIEKDVLRQLGIGYVKEEKTLKDAFRGHPGFKNENDFMACGLFDAEGKIAFTKGSILFPFRKSSKIVYCYGQQLPLRNWGCSDAIEKRLFLEFPMPLLNEDRILASNGLHLIFVCDNLMDVILLTQGNRIAVGVPSAQFFHPTHVEPFRCAQTLLGEERKLRVVLAVKEQFKLYENVKQFIPALERSGVVIEELAHSESSINGS